MKVLAFDATKCTRCRTCELVCSLVKEGRFQPRSARIRVAERPGSVWCLPVSCLQCEDSPCITSCPTGATGRDAATGAIVVDEERCTGCNLCTLVCPTGAVAPANAGEAVRRCDLCGGEPRCVAFCRTEALQYVDLTEPFARRRNAVLKGLHAGREEAP